VPEVGKEEAPYSAGKATPGRKAKEQAQHQSGQVAADVRKHIEFNVETKARKASMRKQTACDTQDCCKCRRAGAFGICGQGECSSGAGAVECGSDSEKTGSGNQRLWGSNRFIKN
jgi:hypothetical protein